MTELKYCESCQREVYSQGQRRPETFPVLGEPIQIEATVALCPNCGSQLYDAILDEANFAAAFDQYRRQHRIPPPSAIRNWREGYGLSQKALGRLLNWGQITVHRYETGAVPNPAHAQLLRYLMASSDHLASWAANKGGDEGRRVEEALRVGGPDRGVPALENSLARLLAPKEESLSGNVPASLEKLGQLLAHFAAQHQPLSKIKAMKLLFYADFRSYQRFGRSVTGLMYVALPFGPALEGWNLLLAALEARGDLALEAGVIGDHPADIVKAVRPTHPEAFSADEVSVLEEVDRYLGPLTAKRLVQLSHEEEGYLQTKPGVPLQYEYARKLLPLNPRARKT